tara:strand:+ start:490 stop:717 length:228 start_codon:yes stop_codon:yes gene_type:complete
MKTAFKSPLKSETFCISKSYISLIEKENSSDGFKFYQKLFVLFIAFLTILIFPDSPKELGNICEAYNSTKICNVW